MLKTETDLRVILLTRGQCEAALERLLRLAGVVVAGVFVETDILRRYAPREALKRSIKYEGWRATFKNYTRKLLGMGNSYDADMKAAESSRERLSRMAEAHDIPIHFINSFHTSEAITMMREASPDLGIIFGTNIIKSSVFRIPRLGSINMHRGLAPIYRGGPPVFWELYNGENEVGITVHFVEEAVDTGSIVLQARVPLAYDYMNGLEYERFIAKFTEGTQDHCASLVAEAVRMVADGTAVPEPQNPDLGKRYRLPTKSEKNELRRRLSQRRRQGQTNNGAFVIHQEARRNG